MVKACNLEANISAVCVCIQVYLVKSSICGALEHTKHCESLTIFVQTWGSNLETLECGLVYQAH